MEHSMVIERLNRLDFILIFPNQEWFFEVVYTDASPIATAAFDLGGNVSIALGQPTIQVFQ
jgi:hypothetical protein